MWFRQLVSRKVTDCPSQPINTASLKVMWMKKSRTRRRRTFLPTVPGRSLKIIWGTHFPKKQWHQSLRLHQTNSCLPSSQRTYKFPSPTTYILVNLPKGAEKSSVFQSPSIKVSLKQISCYCKVRLELLTRFAKVSHAFALCRAQMINVICSF